MKLPNLNWGSVEDWAAAFGSVFAALVALHLGKSLLRVLNDGDQAHFGFALDSDTNWIAFQGKEFRNWIDLEAKDIRFKCDVCTLTRKSVSFGRAHKSSTHWLQNFLFTFTGFRFRFEHPFKFV